MSMTDDELRETYGDRVVESVDFATYSAMRDGGYP
jgi:hypothetical protein